MNETEMAGATRALLTPSATPRSNTTSGRAVAVILKPLIDLHGEPRNWRTAAPLYIEALADIPPDLLAVAVKHAITSNPYFPKPADLRAAIMDELSEYRRRQDAARKAFLMLPAADIPPPTEEQKAEVDALLAEHGIVVDEHGRLRPLEREPMTQAQHAKMRDELAAFRLLDEDDPRVQKRLREMGDA